METKRKINATAAMVISLMTIASAITPAMAADKVKVTLNEFMPSGTRPITEEVEKGTALEDVPEIGALISDPSKAPKYEGAKFKDYTLASGGTVSGKAQVNKDIVINQNYDLTKYTITLHEKETTDTGTKSREEYMKYTIRDSYSIPSKKIITPKYVPENTVFRGWTDTKNQKVIEQKSDGVYSYCIPQGMVGDADFSADYKNTERVSVKIVPLTLDGVATSQGYAYADNTFGEVPWLKNIIENGIEAKKTKGCIFDGIYNAETNKKVMLNDTVKDNQNLYEKVNYLPFTVTMKEAGKTEKFTYTIEDTHTGAAAIGATKNGEPIEGVLSSKKVPDPSYVPDGATFVRWRVDSPTDKKLQQGEGDGGHYCMLPYGANDDYTLTAIYKDNKTGEESTFDPAETKEAKTDAQGMPEAQPSETPAVLQTGTDQDVRVAVDSGKYLIPVQTYSLVNLKVHGVKDKYYTGKNIKQTPYTYINGAKVLLNTTYSNHKNIGKHFIVVAGDAPTFTDSQKIYYNILPAKVKLNIKNTKKMVTVKARNLKGGAKVQIQYRKKGSKTWKGMKKSKKFSKGTYYIRARSYKGNLYSKWSKPSKVIVKEVKK